MDSKNLAIGVLSTTAVILFVGFLVVSSRPAPVLADMTVAKGDYILTVGNSPQVDEEFVYIIDVPEQKLIAYRFNTPQQQLEVVQGVNLEDVRKAATGQKTGGQRRRP